MKMFFVIIKCYSKSRFLKQVAIFNLILVSFVVVDCKLASFCYSIRVAVVKFAWIHVFSFNLLSEFWTRICVGRFIGRLSSPDDEMDLNLLNGTFALLCFLYFCMPKYSLKFKQLPCFVSFVKSIEFFSSY